VEQPHAEWFTYGVSVGGSVAAVLVLAVAVVGGALLGRLFIPRDGR
jgi:hypothetical protein